MLVGPAVHGRRRKVEEQPARCRKYREFYKKELKLANEEFIERLEKLKGEGASILYLTDDIFLAQKVGDTISALKKDSPLMHVNI